jgi:tripartite-type tricarboxylate transporter receptor subunit TctC
LGICPSEIGVQYQPDGRLSTFPKNTATFTGKLLIVPHFHTQICTEISNDFSVSNPGCWSVGFGTQPHLLAEMLKSEAGIDIVHVPYRGNAAAVTDLLAGQVQVYFGTPADILPHVGGGKVRAIAVADTLRFPQLPDVPTTVESGFPNLTAEFWSGILAPAGTPASILDLSRSTKSCVLQTRGLL